MKPGVYGMLGANGAGKTILMRMICGVLKPTRGTVFLDGRAVEDLGEDYRNLLGYLPQDFGYYLGFHRRGFYALCCRAEGNSPAEGQGPQQRAVGTGWTN
ncbi:ATP-binding cassette domain-containing protein [Paenibacillus sp. FSL R5-0912]|uniref:ATP-binding cassette domain-containing protein n=2 Tax=Paenibacillus TaxID=44249 RepID=UPI002F353882